MSGLSRIISLIVILLCVSVHGQGEPFGFFGGKKVAWAVDLDGSSEYMSKSSPNNLDLNGPELITRWADRNFSSKDSLTWTGSGTHTIDTSSTDKRTGSYSGKLVATAAGDSTTNYVTLPASSFGAIEVGKKYTLEGWVRASGVNGADIVGAFDFTSGWAANGTYITIVRADSFTNTGSGYGPYKNILTIGTAYMVSVYGTTTSAGGLKIVNSAGSGSTPLICETTTSGAFAISGVCPAISAGFYIRVTNAGNTRIDSIRVKPITKPTITFGTGTKWKTSDTLSVIPTVFEKVVYNFQATAFEVNQGIRVFVSQADSLYLDDFSIAQCYDQLVNIWFKVPSTAAYKSLIGKSSIGTNVKGWSIFLDDANKMRLLLSDGVTQKSVTSGNTYTSSTDYQLLTAAYDFVNSTVSIWKNGAVDKSAASIATAGNIAGTANFIIGRQTESTAYSTAGYIGHTQIVRFTDIATESINPSAWYVQGLPKSYSTGTIVFEFNPRDGGSDALMLQDYSGNGNNLTGANVTTADRVPATYPVR